MCCNVYRKITDFKVFRFRKKLKTNYIESEKIFFTRKIYSLYTKGYNMAKSSFLTDIL